MSIVLPKRRHKFSHKILSATGTNKAEAERAISLDDDYKSDNDLKEFNVYKYGSGCIVKM
jgi:hypothetical protein